MVAVLLPKARLVVIEEPQSRDPLRALPEIQMRHEKARRPPVFGRERPSVDLPHHPRLAASHIGEWKIRRVSGVRNATTCVALRLGPDASRSVSTETPLKLMPSFDHVVTQWMSPL